MHLLSSRHASVHLLTKIPAVRSVAPVWGKFILFIYLPLRFAVTCNGRGWISLYCIAAINVSDLCRSSTGCCLSADCVFDHLGGDTSIFLLQNQALFMEHCIVSNVMQRPDPQYKSSFSGMFSISDSAGVISEVEASLEILVCSFHA